MIWIKSILAIIFFIASLIYLPPYLFFFSCAVLLYLLRGIDMELSEFKSAK
jgi:hypothetical protein